MSSSSSSSTSTVYQSFTTVPSLAPSAPSAHDYAPPFQPDYSDAKASREADQKTAVSDEGVPTQYRDTLAQMKSTEYVQAFEAKGVTGDALVVGLSRVFDENQIPKGLKSKLTGLKGATLHFKIDDSNSMLESSNLLIKDLSIYVPKDPSKDANTEFSTRWEEAEDRLHRLIDILAYVPTGLVTLSYFDRDNIAGVRATLERKNQTPEDFSKIAHQTVRKLFNKIPHGNTPIYKNLLNMLNAADCVRGKSEMLAMHYILSDGEPYSPNLTSAVEINMIKDLLKGRNAKLNPVTFLGCSNKRVDYEWMHEMEEVADNVGALCDFNDEALEILRAQGPAFDYSKGMWLICNLAAAINPTDLDLLDLRVPLTKLTLDNLFAKVHSELEYSVYFNNHPNKKVFLPDYQLFLKMPNATSIQSVVTFRAVLKRGLDQDIEAGDDDSEERELAAAAKAVMDSRQPFGGNGMFNQNVGGPGQPLLVKPQSSSCCTIL